MQTGMLNAFAEAVAQAMVWKPKMSTFVVCLLTEEENGPIAEMLLTRLARAYYFAGGFSVAQAGASMQSLLMLKRSDQEKQKLWEDWATWVLDPNRTSYRQNHRLEKDLRRKAQETPFADMLSGTEARFDDYELKMNIIETARSLYREVLSQAYFKDNLQQELERLEMLDKAVRKSRQ